MTAMIQDHRSQGSADEGDGQTRAHMAHSAAQVVPRTSQRESDTLSAAQVSDMLGNVLKMASENKITARNTWSLQLIDHLSDLVKSGEERTNFQRASCTLDAGVKIYSSRVDSMHSEAYKVLGGLNRTEKPRAGAAEEHGDGGEEDGDGDGADDKPGRRRKAGTGTADPSSTLAATWEELNQKKFDLAFAVDPLFHKTSAQFDEGGARGLLLYNLSVYRGCEVLFDSLEVPEDALDEPQPEDSVDVVVNLAPLAAQLEALRRTPLAQISPALDHLYALLGRPVDPAADGAAEALVRRALADSKDDVSVDRPAATRTGDAMAASSRGEETVGAELEPHDEAGGYDDYDDGGGGGGFGSDSDAAAGHGGGWQADAGDGDALPAAWGLQAEAGAPGGGRDAARSTIDWLIQSAAGGGAVTRGRGWAGATHWRYSGAAGGGATQDAKPTKKPVKREKKKAAIDFMNPKPIPPGAFDVATRKDQICLKTSTPKNTLLPEDLHYKATDLAHFFLRPKEVISTRLLDQAAAASAEQSGDSGEQYSDFGGDGGAADSDAGYSDGGGGYAWEAADLGDDADLIDAPRRVGKLTVNYASASKQVDVRALKETIWECTQQLVQASGEKCPQPSPAAAQSVSFQDLLSRLRGGRAGRLEDLSVHLAFICVLHLANEHGLAVTGVAALDAMTVSLP